MNGDCIFCKIVAGEIPSALLYEDDDFRVILDKFPSAAGHALIIPKKHSDAIFDLDDETARKIFPLAKRVAAAVQQTLNPDGINILQNNGAAAGQSVSHLHVHVIPRTEGDGIRVGWDQNAATDEQLAALCKQIAVGLS